MASGFEVIVEAAIELRRDRPPRKLLCAKHAPAIVASVGFAILLFHRNYSLFTAPHLWAEDLEIYFTDNRLWGYRALLLPYNGFVQFSCRLTAWLAGFFHPVDTPRIYAVSFLLSICSTAAFTFASSAFSGWYAPLAVFALLIAPVSSEVFLGMCYMQWVLGPIVALALIERQPSRIHGLSLLAGYAMVGISSPFTVIAAPFVAVKIVRDKSSYSLWLGGLTIAAGALQLPHIIGRASMTVQSGTWSDKITAFVSIFYRWITGPGNVSLAMSLTISLLTAAAAGWYLWNNRQLAFGPATYFSAFGLALLAVSCLSGEALPEINQFYVCARYFYIPMVLFIWTFLGIEQMSGRGLRVALFAMLGLAVLYSAHVIGAGTAAIDEKWDDAINCLAKSDSACLIQFNPRWLGKRAVPSDSELANMTDEDRRRFRRVPHD